MGLINLSEVLVNAAGSNEGKYVFDIIKSSFDNKEKIIVSFENVEGIGSSFVNSAFLKLLDYYDYNFIKNNLKIIKINKAISNLIKERFEFELKKREQVENF